MVFFAKQQDAFAGLEENLNIPTLTVNPDNFFLTQMHVRANQCNPILTIVTVTYADNPGIEGVYNKLCK